jgi:hypothetical protein
MAVAHTLAYDSAGTPAYAGQAMMIGSCAGGGSFCHSDMAIQRYGAPHDLNFDPLLADDPSFSDEATGAAHLHDAQLRIFHDRDDIYGSVWNNSMPPGQAGRDTVIPYVQYASESDTNGTPLPGFDTTEGLEMLRAWLACGAPVVESTTAVPARPCASNADCTPLGLCDAETAACVNVGDVVPRRMR